MIRRQKCHSVCSRHHFGVFRMPTMHLNVRAGYTHDNLLPYGVTTHQTTQTASTRYRCKTEQVSDSLTFLASHSCLGRGLLTPIRLSSLGREEKEKTAERRAHFNETCSTDNQTPNISWFLTGKCNSLFPEPSTSASFTLAACRRPREEERGKRWPMER